MSWRNALSDIQSRGVVGEIERTFPNSDHVNVDFGGNLFGVDAYMLAPAGTAEGKVQEYEENPECPACGGPGMELGALGNLTHYRCRNCGMEFNIRESTLEQEMKKKWRGIRGKE
jgi:hypothetical protein